MKRFRFILATAAFLLLFGGFFFACRDASKPTPSVDPNPPDPGARWFADPIDDWGIDFRHEIGDVNRWDLTQIDGSGVAVFDFDGDGRLDLYFLTLGGPDSPARNRLYRNLPEGRFQDVSAGSGLDIGGNNCGVAVGDVNNDGKPDVLVTQVGGCKLFLNLGGGKFQDITATAGILNPLWGTSANFFDYDRDGYLDLVIANYLENDPNNPCFTAGKRTYCGPLAFPGTISKLFRNLGEQPDGRVKFADVTISSGLSQVKGTGLAVYCADWTGDGWPDILIANDAKPNHLWVNQGAQKLPDGSLSKEPIKFKEEAFFRGIAMDLAGMAQAGMGIAVGDIDGDGLLDVYMTHLAIEKNTLWLQGPKRGFFADRTARFGLAGTAWRGTGWGTVMHDFDCDGWPDLAVANGNVSVGTPTPNPDLGPHFQQFSERNQIFRNEGKGQFRDLSEQNAPFCGTPNVARGLAAGDLDGDGAVDLVLTTVANRARVYRNTVRDRGRWLLVQALDPRLKRDAYGAEITVASGGRRQIRCVQPGDSYQCSSDPRAHFGLGAAESYESIRVLWPDGLEEEFPAGAANRVVVLKRGEGRVVSKNSKP